MHPGYQNPDAIAPSGPVDPALTVLSVQSRGGAGRGSPDPAPIAVLANYSMHYYGASPVSADYYGRFAAALARRIGAADKSGGRPFVAIMSQGTSGDQMWMDYGQPQKDPGLDAYADAVAGYAERAYRRITYHDEVPLAIAETKLVLGRRVPDEKRLAWAQSIVAQMKGKDLPRTLPEVYAKEAIYLHDEPRRELKLQAVRIGELGITAIPNEVYAITGLKLKAQSPFATTMNIELANGSEGYIPPPEQHALGGYTTWPARTAGLEVQAEPKIVAAVLGLLEQVAGKPRRVPSLVHGAYARAVLDSKPMAYWRLDDIQGPIAFDSSGHGHHARYENGVAFFLPGPDVPGLTAGVSPNHAVHFAGGRLEAQLDSLPETYSVEMWFWNGLPNNARPVTGFLFARETKEEHGSSLDEWGICGTHGTHSYPGELFNFSYDVPDVLRQRFMGPKTRFEPKTWYHLALVQSRKGVDIYVDYMKSSQEGHRIEVFLGPRQVDEAALAKLPKRLYVGGTADGTFNFEGKIDEVAIYDRALTADEIAGHVRAARAR